MYCAHTAYTPNKADRRSGFTLMEIVAAIFIFSIVIGLVMGSFEGVFSNADHLNAMTDLQEMGNACLNRVTTDLQAIHVTDYPRYHKPDIDDKPDLYHVLGSDEASAGEGTPLLRFASLAHLAMSHEPREGIAEIVYYLQQSGRDNVVLRRADHLYPYPEEFEPNTTDPIMCEKVRSLEFTYFPVQGDPRKKWDSQRVDDDYATPRRIGIILEIGDKDAPLRFTTQVTLPMFRFDAEDQ